MRKFLLVLVALLLMTNAASAEKILFIPHDNRPVSNQQPAEVVAQLGYEILMPPAELLTRPDELWHWLDENAPSADAAVIATDALLYGGLIPSRSHNIDADELQARLKRLETLRQKNFFLKIYAFGSLMRTPRYGTPGDIEEPAYYGEHGGDIFALTALLDKKETDALTAEEQTQLDALQKKIPDEILDDYFARRVKNFAATCRLVDFTGDGVIDYLVIGRDDNAPLSQTHRENRHLLAYIEANAAGHAQSHAGIDEYAMLLLTRAVCDLRDEAPKVHVQFNRGVGAETVPAYSDEQLGDSIRDEILIAGGISVNSPKRADLVMFVNTDRDGRTFHIHNSCPPEDLPRRERRRLRRNAKYFAAQIEDAVAKKLPVSVADVTFANGSDVALMNELRRRGLLFKLQSYSGWNTATNTSGFALGTGILSRQMNATSREKILARRYLDDWGYQTFVRTKIAEDLAKLPDGREIYLHPGEHEAAITARETELMREFIAKNLPRKKFLNGVTVTNPWHRMFECEIHFAD